MTATVPTGVAAAWIDGAPVITDGACHQVITLRRRWPKPPTTRMSRQPNGRAVRTLVPRCPPGHGDPRGQLAVPGQTVAGREHADDLCPGRSVRQHSGALRRRFDCRERRQHRLLRMPRPATRVQATRAEYSATNSKHPARCDVCWSAHHPCNYPLQMAVLKVCRAGRQAAPW